MFRLIIVLLIILPGCRGSHERSFDDLQSAFVNWYYRSHPVISTYHKKFQNSDHYQRINSKYFDEYLADITRFSIELSQIDETKLDTDDLIDYEILDQFLSDEVFEYKILESYLWKINHPIEMIYHGLISVVLNENIQMEDKVAFLGSRLKFIEYIIQDLQRTIMYFTENEAILSIHSLHVLYKLLNEIPLLIMSDNNTLDKIDDLIKKTLNHLKLFEKWINLEYSKLPIKPNLFTAEFYNDNLKRELKDDYTIEDINQLSKNHILSIQNKMFFTAIKLYNIKNDEPIWVDRDDTLMVIEWALDSLYTETIQSGELISTVYNSINNIQNFNSNHRIFPIYKKNNLELMERESYTQLLSIFQDNLLLKNDFTNKHIIKLDKNIVKENSSIHKFDIDISNITNLFPGSYFYQIKNYKQSRKLRKLFPNSKTLQGWSNYSAFMMMENEFGGSLFKIKYLHYLLINVVIVRAELDYFINHFNQNKIIDYISNSAFLDKNTSQKILDGIKETPYISLDGFIGFIEFENLKNRYLKGPFTKNEIYQFHLKIINSGIIPISAIRKKIMDN